MTSFNFLMASHCLNVNQKSCDQKLINLLAAAFVASVTVFAGTNFERPEAIDAEDSSSTNQQATETRTKNRR